MKSILSRRAVRLGSAAVALALAALSTPAPAADDVVAVQLAHWTGPAGEIGWSANVGLKLAFDEANEDGGIRGRRLRLVFEDEDDGDPGRQVRALYQRWSPVALVGSVDPAMVHQLAKQGILEELQLPVVGVASGDVALRQLASPYVTFTRASAADELKAVFSYLATLGATRVALVLSSPYSSEIEQQAPALANAAGIQLVSRLDDADAMSAQTAASRVAASQPNAVVMASSTARTSEFFAVYRSLNASTPLVSLSTAEPTRLASFSSKAAARGVVFSLTVPNPRDRNLPLVNEFLKAFTRLGPAGVSPTTGMLEAYISARVLIEGLRHAPRSTSAALTRTLAREKSMWIDGLSVNLHDGGAVNRVSLTVLDGEGKMLW